MSQTKAKYKPIDQTTFKARFALSQCKMQQSFKKPHKIIPHTFNTLMYMQCLQYSIDLYSKVWFGQQRKIFSYLDISTYTTTRQANLIGSSLGIFYVAFFIVLITFQKQINQNYIYVLAKFLQIGYSSILFVWMVGNNMISIKSYTIIKDNSSVYDFVSLIMSIISLITCTILVVCQTLTRFDFISRKGAGDMMRTSNWSHVTLQLYLLINQISSHLINTNSNQAHLIIMSITFTLHVFMYILKFQHEQDSQFKIQFCAIAVNFVAIIILLSIKLLNLSFDFGLFIIFSIITIIATTQVQFFNLTFQLQNVNKWTNSQIMISYAAKLRKIRLKFKDYYFNTLYLGYVQIHQQKCDHSSCPLRVLPPDDQTKLLRFQDIIKKIYNDGCKLSPVNPELLLEYAIFHFQTGARQKSLKTLLEIKQNQLPLDKYYKFYMLRKTIHRQISQIPKQQFLDLLSEIQINDLQQKITQKFEQAALITLQFWSILNQDHPDFGKLYKVGKNKSIVSQQIHSLYKQINQIAFSERVTCLYIHYLNQIQNQQKIYTNIEYDLKNSSIYDNKIVIEDWTNNSNPVMIVSIEQQRLGTIIDLNTTCATMLGYQKLDLLGRQIKNIFPGVLSSQIQSFMDSKNIKSLDQEYYFGESNGFSMKFSRKIQPFNSIQTGISVLINIQQKLIQNFGFLIFNNDHKLITMSSSCLQLLNLNENILQSQNYFENIFILSIQQLSTQKNLIKIKDLVKQSQNNKKDKENQQQQKQIQKKIFERSFNVWKKKYTQFQVIQLTLSKNNKTSSNNKNQIEIRDNLQDYSVNKNFTFKFLQQCNQFVFIGSIYNKSSQNSSHNPVLYQSVQPIESGKQKNYGEYITTLRLHQNYIKVIEQSEQQNQDGDNKSQTSTNNQLITRSNQISKADQQKIFQSRQSYYNFIDKNMKKIYLRTGICVGMVICIGIYIGLYFSIKGNYSGVFQQYNRLALGNQIIGQIASANKLIYQTKYRAQSPNPQTEQILLQNYNETLQYLSKLSQNYSLPYMMNIYIDQNTISQFRSDEFILNYINEFSKVYDYVKRVGFNNITLDSNSSTYINLNGKASRPIMHERTANFKKTASNNSSSIVKFAIFFNVGGVVISLLITGFLLFTLKKNNEYKTEILSIFLQTTQKDIQSYSQKTQNFLITLHVDQSNQNNNEPIQEDFQNKKSSNAIFAKKKRFKTTEFPKTPYLVLISFLFFASAYYIHLFSYTVQKDIFIVNAIQYLNIASNYSDVFSTSQSLIYQNLINNYGKPPPVNQRQLISDINTNILTYQRDFFTWHYKTYGNFDSYHQKFATVFMRDICNGQINIKYACDASLMATNGTLLIVTDVTVQNQLIDFSKPLDSINPQYYLSVETIKQAHKYLFQEVMYISQQFFDQLHSNILMITLIWIFGLLFGGFLIELYIQKTVILDNQLVKKMLKFFPVSFAKQSEGVNNFVAVILKQEGF